VDSRLRRSPPDRASAVPLFREFAEGCSPRAIAKRLNFEGIPGPEGRPWGDTTIRGQTDRGTGILNNALYAGRLEWNRCSYIKDPRTGKRIARPNPRSKWEIVEIPDLRIVDDGLWARVKARQQETRFEIGCDEQGNALNRAHRRRYLLSGLIVCGCCGGAYTIVGPDRYGCATRRSKGTCSNTLRIGRNEIEARVLEALRERMMGLSLSPRSSTNSTLNSTASPVTPKPSAMPHIRRWLTPIARSVAS
jgi:site-specific DNA recombinase